MKRLWILYICTWIYDIFWNDFYNSCEKYLLKDLDYEKHYFVRTDSNKIKGSDNVHVIFQKNLWRPDNTLKRFHFFLSKEDDLKKMDYLYFFNANLEFKEPIWEEFLPKEKEVIVVAKHPWFFNKSNVKFTYDRNPKSTSYIKKWEWTYYVQWALNWWTSYSYLKMCRTLAKNIDTDERNWIIALRHDESHLNRYVYDLEMNGYSDRIKILPPSYIYPETGRFSFPCKILARDKTKYIDTYKLKWITIPLYSKIKIFLWKKARDFWIIRD